MRSFNYIKAIVIVHGKSELQLCQHIKQKLRIKIEIESKNKGESSIQINSIFRVLNNSIFKTKNGFLNHYQNIEIVNKKINEDLKIFIVMDTDDCSFDEKKAFIDKSMFKDHWAYDYIVPIYNSPNLEEVLKKSGITYKNKKPKDMKKEYVKIFPTEGKYEKDDIIQLEEISKNLKRNKDTNLNELIDFCLEL